MRDKDKEIASLKAQLKTAKKEAREASNGRKAAESKLEAVKAKEAAARNDAKKSKAREETAKKKLEAEKAKTVELSKEVEDLKKKYLWKRMQSLMSTLKAISTERE